MGTQKSFEDLRIIGGWVGMNYLRNIPGKPPPMRAIISDILPIFSKFFRRREGQAAFAIEKFFQPPVAGTALAPDDFRRHPITHFATKPPPFQPVFPTD